MFVIVALEPVIEVALIESTFKSPVIWDDPEITPLDTRLIVLVAASIAVVIPPPSPLTFRVSVLRSIPSVPESPDTVNVWLNPDTVEANDADRSVLAWSAEELNEL